MKALILAAGFGTRLLPHTRHLPKPLFPIDGRTLLDRTIGRLAAAGVTGIVVNVHHLHDQITDFIKTRSYPVPVVTAYEEVLLGTGGAMKNVADFLGDGPFFVINGDVLTDIDLSRVREFHGRHPHPATLVVHDYPEFNNVWVDPTDHIQAFSKAPPPHPGNLRCLAFTGIQILDPVVLDFIPAGCFFSSIDAFRNMIAAGYHLAAYPAHGHYWRDMGTPESFFEAAYESTAPQVFERVFGFTGGQILRIPLSGDGSDRRWFRLASPVGSLILADHGIHSAPETGEADAFVRIGRHLRKKGVPVPEIHHTDSFSGLVYLEDLGDTHLQSLVLKEPDASRTKDLYRQAIDALITMHHEGAKDFEPAWTCQTPAYDRDLILGKECRYFVEAFLSHYLNLPVDWKDLREECEALADLALAHAVTGLLHRDCQSRNIMAKDGRLFFIDFQGARSGPLQYDLASLLTDPYVGLSPETEEELLTYCIQRLKEKRPVDPEGFRVGYRYCCLTRIMQSLGAFGFLTKVKNKPFFARFIPVALTNLNRRLRQPGIHPFPLLTDAAKTALMAWEAAFGPSPASTPPLT